MVNNLGKVHELKDGFFFNSEILWKDDVAG